MSKRKYIQQPLLEVWMGKIKLLPTNQGMLGWPETHPKVRWTPLIKSCTKLIGSKVEARNQNTAVILAGRRKKEETLVLRMAWLTISTTEIEYRYSEAPIDLIPLLGDPLSAAVQSSQQWKWERNIGVGLKTDCLNALAPKNRSQDISITLLVGFEKGTRLIEKFQLVPR